MNAETTRQRWPKSILFPFIIFQAVTASLITQLTLSWWAPGAALSALWYVGVVLLLLLVKRPGYISPPGPRAWGNSDRRLFYAVLAINIVCMVAAVGLRLILWLRSS